MDQFKRENPDKEAHEYQTRLDETYRRIGQLYNEATFYQVVIVQEVKDLLQTFPAPGLEI
ncbi:hypothetical protein [Paenibacillus lactis]|jgi:hypothetical protein|uniref:hypothetical protein n=1 Tax=Paenibacillus lactis TaxID=228574 RepID=UPI00030DDF38|nr:hypothetical protein [Paenibacillus lactis]GIO92212.1 hypothetical protein J31TS3_34390 [Paenibacillus lactis]